MYTILLVIHSIIVLFLIMMILVQRTGDDGLSGLGGGGGNQFLTGRSQANLLTRTTAILAGLFMATSLTLAVMAGRMTGGSILDTVPAAAQTAPAPKAAAPEAAKPKAPETPAVPRPE
ncbi:MAG: preprotein translocase subunit SecG [Pseudomonadota bacterium]|nr:preprotein translocase subunit SecG [Pseudomonadota bacterium]